MSVRPSSKAVFFRRQPVFLLLINSMLLFSALLLIYLSEKKSSNSHDVQSAAPLVTDFDAVQYLVPAEPVAAGTKIRNIRFKRISYPRHQVPPGALANPESMPESVVLAALPANLPLFMDNLAKPEHLTNPVLDKIPPGMRAMTIKVDATAAVEGWAGSGSVVDILLIEKNRTSVVAEKVRILSAERSVAPVDGHSAPVPPSTVTLLVTQAQCLAINTAIPLGKIAFALRSSRDEEAWADTEFSSLELSGRQSVADSRSGDIKGVASFKSDEMEKSFALTDGRWIRTEKMPQGFLIESN